MAELWVRQQEFDNASPVTQDNPVPVRFPEGHVVEVAGSAALIDVDLTVETSALDANDVAAATQEVKDAARVAGGCVELKSLQIIDYDDQGAELYIVFFDANTALGLEDAAVTLTDLGTRSYLGHVLVPTTDYADFVGVKVACKRDLGLILQAGPGSRSVWVAAWTSGTPTYAGGIVRLRLGLVRF